MDGTDVTELLFYMEMTQADTEKERCKFKMCLSDKLFMPSYPLPTALVRFLEQPSCVGTVSHTRRRRGSGARGTARCPSSGTSLSQT